MDTKVAETIAQMKQEAQEAAALAQHEDDNNYIYLRSDGEWKAFHAAQDALREAAHAADQLSHLGAWRIAFDLLAELASRRTNEQSIEAPYRALALIRLELDRAEAAADGFNAVELAPPVEMDLDGLIDSAIQHKSMRSHLTITSTHYPAE